jgi:hypothetical protein
MNIVALSGGKNSTAMALRLAEVEPRSYAYVCTPTGDELPEMEAHWRRCEELLGQRIERIQETTLVDVTKKAKMLPNWRARFCTPILKIVPFQKFVVERSPAVVYVGLRADEEGREGMRLNGLKDIELRYPLREWGWGIMDVLDYLAQREVTIPWRTDCARCFYQTLHEWWRLWKEYPEIYESAVDDEQRTGHTYRSPQRDTQPTALVDLAAKFEAGYQPKAHKRGEGCRACSM